MKTYHQVRSADPAIDRVVFLRCDTRKRAEAWRNVAASCMKTHPRNGNGITWPILKIETVRH